METKILPVSELKELFLQSLLNKVDGKISKISDNSVLNGLAYGVAKVNQKGMKDSALIEAELFPEYAYGANLDRIAKRYGIVERQTNKSSTVFVRLVAAPGSIYIASDCTFFSRSGLAFVLEADITIGDNGFAYAKLRSSDTGNNTNVAANSITRVTLGPSGHLYVINEIAATGGIDVEDDLSLQNRLLQNFNNFSLDTIAKLRYIFTKLNPLILDVKKLGVSIDNKTVLGIVTTNGIALSQSDIDLLISNAKYYLSLSEQPITNNLDVSPNIIIQNIDFTYIDLDFRIDLYSNIDTDVLRQNIQTQLNNYLDFRTWTDRNVQWEELFFIVRNQAGIRSIPEQFFSPNIDVPVSQTSLPRLRGFIMRNIDGSIIVDNNNAIVPIFYSSEYFSNLFQLINTTF